MKAPSLGLIAGGTIGGAALLLAVLGAPSGRRPAAPPAPVAAPAPTVAGGGVVLASTRIALPDETATLPPGPNVDLVAARCTACHSAEMILTQPALSRDQWQATVTKMRDVYHAPVPAGDEAAILAYLTSLAATPPRSREPT